jgi:Fe-S cluster biosynthesis and repair protein YggX
MRAAHKPEWLYIPNKPTSIFCGVRCGSDFCAEHEWGIEDMHRTLNAPTKDENLVGIPRRTCNNVDKKNYATWENGKSSYLVVDDNLQFCKDQSSGALSKHYDRFLEGDGQVSCAWDGRGFLIRVKEHPDRIKTLYEAIQANQLAVWLGGRQMLFDNPGLCVADVRLLTDEIKKNFIDSDKDSKNLTEAAEKTGIRRRLESYNTHRRQMFEVETGQRCLDFNIGCQYMALSPAWRKGHKVKTKHPVIFWLNPHDQKNNNYGWFTVEELDLWIKGEGPIPKQKKQQARRHYSKGVGGYVFVR